VADQRLCACSRWFNDPSRTGVTSRLSENTDLRASDAEREAFGERLRRHHADGRLTTDEFQERIDRCYSAKTSGELQQLVTDLPAEHARERRLPVRRRLWLVPLVPIVIVVAVASLVGGVHHHWHGGGWEFVLVVAVVLRFMFWGRYRRVGMWRGPERQM
jgi:Domain of unknown function (DUF1707)